MSRFLHGSGVGVAGAAPELACCGTEGSPSAGVAGGGFMTGSTYFRQLKSSRYKQITPSPRTHGRIGRPEQRRQYPSCPVRVFWPPASHRSFCPESLPSWAINRITVLAVSTVLGTAFLFRMKGARHSSASNSRSVGKSGKVRPRRMRRLMRQAMTMCRVSAVCSFLMSLSWSFSTCNPALLPTPAPRVPSRSHRCMFFESGKEFFWHERHSMFLLLKWQFPTKTLKEMLFRARSRSI